MTDAEILERAFKKVLDNGFTLVKLSNFYNFIVFSHQFARAFWGEEAITLEYVMIDRDCSSDVASIIYKSFHWTGLEYVWEYHLQQMAREENPLKYIEKFL